MNPAVLSLIVAFAVVFALMLLNVSMGWTMMLGGLAGFAIYGMLGRGVSILQYMAWSGATNQSLVCMPLYIAMGQLLFESGFMSRLLQLVMSILGRLKLRGGLAMGVVIACSIFSAVSGSVMASIGCFAPVAIPEAAKYHYNKNFIAITLAMSSTLDAIIPPSVAFIIYAFLTETSIAKLFMAGIIPGYTCAILYCLAVFYMVKRNPSLAPEAPPVVTWRETGRLFVSNIPVFVIGFLVLGGIFLGWFTPTESAGIGAFLVLAAALVTGKVNGRQIASSFLSAGETMAMMFIMFEGANLMSNLVTITQSAAVLAQFIASLALSRYVFMLAVFVMYYVLGSVLGSTLMIVTLPVIFPLVKSFGFDPIWFGIFTTFCTNIASISPPIAPSVFITEATAQDPEVTTAGMFKLCWPFLFASCLMCALITFFPQICLWLPSKMG